MRLYFVAVPAKPRSMHIARTTISGCTTECGIPLKRGWSWSYARPAAVCAACDQAIAELNAPRGLRA